MKTKDKAQTQMGVLSSIGYMLRTIFQADKGCVIFSFFKNCSEEIFMAFFVVYFNKMLYTYVSNASPFSNIVRLVIIFCSIHILIHISSAFHAYYIRYKTPEVYRKMFSKVIDKAINIDYCCYERPDFYNKFSRALDECLVKAMDALAAFSLAVGRTFSVIAAVSIVATIDPVLILFLIPPVVISFWLGAKQNKLQFDLRTAETPSKRKTDYTKRVFYEKKYAGEIRLFDIRNVLFGGNKDSFRTRYEINVSYRKKIFLLQLVEKLFLFCFMSASMSLYTAYVVKITGTELIGAYISILMTSGFITWSVSDAVRKYIEAGKNCLFMNNLKEFFAFESDSPTEAQTQKPLTQSKTQSGAQTPLTAKPIPDGVVLGDIVFDKVSFTYEGAAAPTINDLSFSIKKGEKIALVGENGAGKTTLVKLLMALYTVSGGKILINDRNVSEYDRHELHTRFGTVFQDLQIFSLPLSENVLLRTPETEADRQLVIDSLKKAQFGDKLEKLPMGIDTPVTKEFDANGFVCSGGQAQKIAIARVFAKNADIIILDEPSSALDPIAEYNMYNNMLSASQGKTVFFISHRLSSARIADRIIFLENGTVAEMGTHDELIAKNGKYANMFNLQAANYREKSWQTVEGKVLYE